MVGLRGLIGEALDVSPRNFEARMETRWRAALGRDAAAASAPSARRGAQGR
jgi:hypothetical protein